MYPANSLIYLDKTRNLPLGHKSHSGGVVFYARICSMVAIEAGTFFDQNLMALA
jgi:hypothetical protein